jgi:hypothetical protein
MNAPRTVKGRHMGVPGFFRACCREASRGGLLGYDHPAYQMSRHLAHQMPYDVEEDEWQVDLDRLAWAIESGDDCSILAWFDDHYTQCMSLVPHRRRGQFLTGVTRAWEAGEIDLG